MTRESCRICLKDTKSGQSISGSICEQPIWFSIAEIAAVTVEVSDGLPQEICNECFEELRLATELRIRIRNSDETLRAIPQVKLEESEWDEVKYEDDDDDALKVETFVEPLIIHKEESPFKATTKKESPTEPKRVRKRKQDPPQCCMCGKLFTTPTQLKQHCDTLHPDGLSENKPLTVKHRFPCPYCKRKFRVKKFLREHYKSVDFVEPKRDRTSEKRSQALKNKLRRYKYNVICSSCGLLLHDQRSLEMHEMSKHSTVRDIPCDVEGCKSTFGHAIALKKHKQACHSEKKYICDYCGRNFMYLRQLKAHIYIHLDIKPFKCTQCERSYSTNYVLKAHIKASHSEVEYPFQCDLCEKAYKWKEDLKAHRSALHFGKFPFVCKFCGKGYTSGSTKKWHENRCTVGQTPHQQVGHYTI